MATGNGFGVSFFFGALGTAAVVDSYGDNEISGNGTNVSGGTLTLLMKQ
jgi:hypothetical protein